MDLREFKTKSDSLSFYYQGTRYRFLGGNFTTSDKSLAKYVNGLQGVTEVLSSNVVDEPSDAEKAEKIANEVKRKLEMEAKKAKKAEKAEKEAQKKAKKEDKKSVKAEKEAEESQQQDEKSEYVEEIGNV